MLFVLDKIETTTVLHPKGAGVISEVVMPEYGVMELFQIL